MIKNRCKAIVNNNRWLKYAATTAATVAAAGLNSEVDADITYVNVGAALVDANPGTFSPDYFGPYTFGAAGASFSFLQRVYSSFPLYDMDAKGHGNISFAWFASSGAGYIHYARNLNFAAFVSSYSFRQNLYGADVLANNRNTYAQFGDPGIAYLGFRFDVGNGTQYGFAELIMDGGPRHTGFLTRYAYADPGESIRAGQIPEPSSLGMMALGSIGLLSWRRSRANSE